jgi:S-adenosylmethionine decarboxylase proenzyme
MKTLGHHTLIELCGCDPERLKRVPDVRRWMLEAARLANGTIVRDVFHEFSPWGVSGVVVIAESHLTIHTWPEHGYAAVDVFSCSRKLRQAAIRDHLRRKLGARRVTSLRVRRGPDVPAATPVTAVPRKPRSKSPPR